MHANRPSTAVDLVARFARGLGIAALLLAMPAVAAPPAGTVISNQADASALIGGAPFSRPSNVVQFTTAAPPVSVGATLVLNGTQRVPPGTTVYFPHTLTNGSATDTFALSLVNLPGTFDLGSLAILPDVDGNGVPDSFTPVPATVTLAPGGIFRFVVGATAPGGVVNFSRDALQVNALSTTPGGPALVNYDAVEIYHDPPLPPPDVVVVTKSFSVVEGPSPFQSILVTLHYGNTQTPRSDFRLRDTIPAGLEYVPGSARWSVSGATPLTDAPGGDPAGIAYDFGATQPGTVFASLPLLAPREEGMLTFRLDVAAGRPFDEVLTNVAQARWTDSTDSWWRDTDPATYRVIGSIDLTLTGDRIDLAQPGTTVTFNNILTNRGTVAETFNILLGTSTFPPGTVFRLYGPDGATPLADTSGDGVVDVGPLAANASFRIVVKADLPAAIVPGEYTLQKTAQSVRSPSRRATAIDSVGAVATRCSVVLTPDNQAQSAYGRHVTYTHYLENRGNCDEPVRVTAGYITDSLPGWMSRAFVDSPVAGGTSIPGVLDPTDTPVVEGWSIVLAPGQGIRILVDVLAPPDPAATSAVAAKASVTNVTTLVIQSATSGALQVVDRTTIEEGNPVIVLVDVLRNFTDPSYQVATAWAVVGGTAWLRADAPSCNASPDAVDSRTIVITGPNGEREEVQGVETGPNTGIFVAPSMPIRAPPVVAGDRILQGRDLDVFDAEILGCGRRIATTITITDPVGVVFDSASNEPVPGAIVTLLSASAGQCTTVPVTTEGNPATTDVNGRYAFLAVDAGDYCLSVAPPNGHVAPSRVPFGQLVPGRNLVVSGPTSGGSYGQAFRTSRTGIVVDIPVDPVPQSGLFVQKTASRTVVDMGAFVDYRVQVRNGTGNALDRASVQLVDDLPAGFAYVSGSVRSDGRTIADPPSRGPRLVLAVGALAKGQEIAVTYRVRVGPGALQGDGTNRVQAFYTANGVTTASNVATAKVQVQGDVFNDRGFILGKVYLDCNANGVQDKGEIGVPGVRLLIEDGTYVITDGQGRYSFYGLSNRTHALKVDPTTLPAGARLGLISARQLGDAASRIVDLKAGEMHRGDFAVLGCDGPVGEDVKARVKLLGKEADALASMAGMQLATEPRPVQDTKALPAAGIVTVTTTPSAALPNASGAAPSTGGAFTSVVPGAAATRPTPAPGLIAGDSTPGTAAPGIPPPVPLEDLVPGFDKELAFVGIKDGDVLPIAQTTIRVKGTAGATFKLSVNGVEVGESHVGKRATLAETQVQAWEYFGVELKAGANDLSVSQVDPFGNARGTVAIRVTAPGKAAKLVVELPKGGAFADGRTPVRILVKVQDAEGVSVTSRTAVTLASSLGQWRVDDLDPAEPGVQTFIEGGRGDFALSPPLEPASSQVTVTSGRLRAEERLDFLPDLRPLIATGVLEGVVNLRNINSRALLPARSTDGFEQELSHLSRDWNDGKGAVSARAAFFLKGKIKGDYLLTAAYDSDKDTKERLFRDIQPDDFYPIYGDSAVRGYDAQSTSRLYVRIDRNRSYLLWGDFNTQATGDTRKLSNYNRSLTGVKEHFENDRVKLNAFASRDTTRQVIEELRANGTSGPYALGTAGLLENSERVEIVTRDRNQPALILSSLAQSRFADYEIEALTGRLLFRSTVSSVDRDLNPVFIRVTYEVDQGGESFWVGGVDAQLRITDRIELGGTYVKDKNPLQPFTLAGASVAVKVGEGTTVIGEVARTEGGTGDLGPDAKGDAARIEVKHESKDIKAQAYIARSDREFNNPGAWISNGRSEAGGRAEYKVREGTQIRAEALRTEDLATSSVRDGAVAAISQRIAENMTFELGLRYAAESGTASPVPQVEGQPAPQAIPSEVTTVRARLTGKVPFVKDASVYGEAEVDVNESDRKIFAVGGEFPLPNRGRIYGRHEFVSSITGPYGLNPAERQNTTAVGIDMDYMKDGRIFSEYRIRDAISGGDAEAALGLKNLWTLSPGLRLGTSVERVHALSGAGQNENTAGAVALEYSANPLWKGTTRLELRDASTTESVLFTVGLAARLSRDWTALLRNAYSLQRTKETGNELVVERLQAGLAWRDTETNRWNALGRVEHRLEQNDTLESFQLKSATTIFSLHADWQPRRPFLVSGRYAAKWTTDKSNGLSSRYRAQVIGGRATWEFAPRWDIGFVTSLLLGENTDSRRYGVGLELGYMITTNLWASAGYNFFGYSEADLAGADYTSKGPYIRLRYKFDESILPSAESRP